MDFFVFIPVSAECSSGASVTAVTVLFGAYWEKGPEQQQQQIGHQGGSIKEWEKLFNF